MSFKLPSLHQVEHAVVSDVRGAVVRPAQAVARVAGPLFASASPGLSRVGLTPAQLQRSVTAVPGQVVAGLQAAGRGVQGGFNYLNRTHAELMQAEGRIGLGNSGPYAFLNLIPEGGVVAAAGEEAIPLGAYGVREGGQFLIREAPAVGDITIEGARGVAGGAAKLLRPAADYTAEKVGVTRAGLGVAKTAVKWVGGGLAVGGGVYGAGYLAGLGLQYAGYGLASGASYLLGTSQPSAPGSGGGSGGTSGGTSSSTGGILGSLGSSPIVLLLIIGGLAFVGYEAVKHSKSSGGSSSGSAS